MHHSFRWLALTIVLSTATGCAEDVAGVMEGDRTLTVYGYLDPSADTQAVRVYPIDTLLRTQPAAPLDVEVRTVDLATGEAHHWQDSIVHFRDGTFGNVYWSAFRPAYEGAYRLELRTDDGEVTTASVNVPGRVTPTVGETVRTNPTGWPADMRIPVSWSGGPGELVRTDLHYRLAYASRVYDGCFELRDTTVVIQNAVAPTKTATGWDIEVHLTKDVPRLGQKLVTKQILASPDGGFLLMTLAMEVFVGDPAWIPPGGHFDQDLLSDPRLFTNVTNGFGFVGAGYSYRIDLPYDEEAPALAGFTPPGEFFSDDNACRDPARP